MGESVKENRFATQEDLSATAPSSLWKEAWKRFYKNKTAVWALVVLALLAIGAIFAGLTEIGQSLLPYRYQDIRDFYADCVAIGLAGTLTFIIDVSKMRKAR